MRRLTFDELLHGEIQVSIVNEPLDFVVEELSAIEIAQRRWRYAELISGDQRNERRL